jgi:hypothetical protein
MSLLPAASIFYYKIKTIAKFIFLSTARHVLSSWHFCVDQLFQAITIQAVEHLPILLNNFNFENNFFYLLEF